MNNTIISVVLALVVGIGIGWVAKPATQNRETKTASQAYDSSPGAKPTSPSPSPLASPIGGSAKSGPRSQQADPDESPQSLSVSWESAEDLRKEQEHQEAKLRQSNEDQIADLTRRLSLTPEQQDQLRRTHFEALVAQQRFFSQPRNSGGAPPDVPSLGATLGLVLTPEQTVAYNELRQSNMRASARQETFEELADLSFLHLTRDQQDAAYDVIYNEIETDLLDSDARSEATAGALVGAIIGNDVGGGGETRRAIIGASVGGFSGPDDDPVDPQEVERRRQEQVDRQIAEKIERIAEVLTPEQVEEYRLHLERSYPEGPFFYNPPSLYLPPLE